MTEMQREKMSISSIVVAVPRELMEFSDEKSKNKTEKKTTQISILIFLFGCTTKINTEEIIAFSHRRGICFL